MKKIDCGVICDLIPLCLDKVASKASEELVMEHIKTCDSCKREFYEDMPESRADVSVTDDDDKKIIGAIRMNLVRALAVLFFAGAVLGIVITSGVGVFFNFTIMPLIGAVAYIAFRPRFYIAPLTVACMAMLYGAVNGEFLSYAIYAVIYAWFIMIGYFAAFLFRFAFFGKEDKSVKKPMFCGKKAIAVVTVLCLIPVVIYFWSVISVYMYML